MGQPLKSWRAWDIHSTKGLRAYRVGVGKMAHEKERNRLNGGEESANTGGGDVEAE